MGGSGGREGWGREEEERGLGLRVWVENREVMEMTRR